jgi:hypothetical protein
MQSRAFDRANVHEDVLATVIRLDESKALLAIEPLHDSLHYVALLSGACEMRLHASAADWVFEWDNPAGTAAFAGKKNRTTDCSCGNTCL